MRTHSAILGLGVAACAAFAVMSQPAQAQTWPQRQVTVVVPFTAGGTTDLFGRIIADGLQQKYGKPFIVENRPGAGGNVGSAVVAKAAPDGYTMLIGTISSHAINPYVYKNIPYDVDKDFAPVSLIATLPNMLAVGKAVPANTFKEFVDYVKANPGKLNFASSGAGTSPHLAAELFALKTGTKMTHVPFRSSGDTMNALLGGHVQFAFDNATIVLPQVQAGNVKGLAVTTKTRSAMAPDIPAVAETIPGFEAPSWHGVFFPAGVPKAIIEQVSADVRTILTNPTVVKRLTEVGATPSPMTPEEFQKFLTAERAKWKEVAQAINLKVD